MSGRKSSQVERLRDESSGVRFPQHEQPRAFLAKGFGWGTTDGESITRLISNSTCREGAEPLTDSAAPFLYTPDFSDVPIFVNRQKHPGPSPRLGGK